MANEKTYVIRLTKDGGSGAYEEISYSPQGNLSSQEGKINKKQSTTQNVAQMLAFKVGTDAVKYSLSNYGELTGDYVGQEAIEDITGIAGDIFMIAKGGWLGVAAVGVKYATKIATTSIRLNKSKTRASMMQERVGITTIKGW
jgi:hypothetical protein